MDIFLVGCFFIKTISNHTNTGSSISAEGLQLSSCFIMPSIPDKTVKAVLMINSINQTFIKSILVHMHQRSQNHLRGKTKNFGIRIFQKIAANRKAATILIPQTEALFLSTPII